MANHTAFKDLASARSYKKHKERTDPGFYRIVKRNGLYYVEMYG